MPLPKNERQQGGEYNGTSKKIEGKKIEIQEQTEATPHASD
jgi:hypothetical protein